MDMLIDGVRYVPAEKGPDAVKFYYMHDNHTFTRLDGITLDAILADADSIERASSYGMLCGPILCRDGREVRRVNTSAHSGASTAPKAKWNAGKLEWRKAVEADADVMRLLHTNVPPPPSEGKA